MRVHQFRHSRVRAPVAMSPMRWVSAFRVLKELPQPHRSGGNPEPISDLPTVRLGQFPEVSDHQAVERLRALFSA